MHDALYEYMKKLVARKPVKQVLTMVLKWTMISFKTCYAN